MCPTTAELLRSPTIRMWGRLSTCGRLSIGLARATEHRAMWGRLSTCGRLSIGLPRHIDMPHSRNKLKRGAANPGRSRLSSRLAAIEGDIASSLHQ